MDASKLAVEALAFVLTYAIHSTLLLGAACLLARRIDSLALRERMWKCALVGGVATALLQAGLAWRTPFAHWTLRAEHGEQIVASETLSPGDEISLQAERSEWTAPQELDQVATSASVEHELAPSVARVGSNDADSPSSVAPAVAERESVSRRASEAEEDLEFADEPFVAGSLAQATPAPDLSFEPSADSRPDAATAGLVGRAFELAADTRLWTLRGLVVWGAFAAFSLAGFAVMWLRLGRRLRGRRELTAGALRAQLDELVPLTFGRRVRVRLYEAPELVAPISFGVVRRSICVPPRALVDLAPDEQATMLAHELAHLARRDPLWLSAAWWIEKVFFFQPLNRVARGQLIELAELECDDWAVRRTGDRLALASCLTRIAGWVVAGPRGLAANSSLPAMSMADTHGRSCLTRRVERLLEDARDERPPHRWAPAALGAATFAAALLAPGVRADRAPVDDVERASAAEPRDSNARSAAPVEDESAAQGSEPEDSDADAEDASERSFTGLVGELGALDEGIAELESELDALRGELGDGELARSLARTLDSLSERMTRLRARRATLERIVTSLSQLEVEPEDAAR